MLPIPNRTVLSATVYDGVREAIAEISGLCFGRRDGRNESSRILPRGMFGVAMLCLFARLALHRNGGRVDWHDMSCSTTRVPIRSVSDSEQDAP